MDLKERVRELTTEDLRAKARELLGFDYDHPHVHAAVELANWAIAESKPQLCGPSADEVWHVVESLESLGEKSGFEAFGEWFNANFKPSAEYEKRIAELQAALTEQRRRMGSEYDDLDAKLKTIQCAAHTEIDRLQAEVERLKPNAKLGQFLLDTIDAIGDAGLEDGWPRDEQINAFIETWRRQKDEIERLKAREAAATAMGQADSISERCD